MQAQLERLLAAPARPGGLLERMRARGTLAAACLGQQPALPSGAIVDATPPRPPQPAPRLGAAAAAGAAAGSFFSAVGDAVGALVGAVTPSRCSASGKASASSAKAKALARSAAKATRPPTDVVCLVSPASATKRKAPRFARSLGSNAKAARMEMPAPKYPPLPKVPRQRRAQRPVRIRVLRRDPLPRKRSQDNYDMSDREGSDGEIANVVRSKRVPEWCCNYQDRVNLQKHVNPDTIFGTAVPSCNLDDVFPDTLYKSLSLLKVKRNRGSSRMWHQDGLRPDEVESYAKKMGHTRRLGDPLRRDSLDNLRAAQPAQLL